MKAAGIPTVMSEVTMVASTYTKLEGKAANQMMRLLEALEDLDDVQNVLLELRHGRRADGARGRISAPRQAGTKAARLWRSFFGNNRESESGAKGPGTEDRRVGKDLRRTERFLVLIVGGER